MRTYPGVTGPPALMLRAGHVKPEIVSVAELAKLGTLWTHGTRDAQPPSLEIQLPLKEKR